MGIPALPFFGTELIDKLPSETIENPHTIGEHIRKRRSELHLKQSELASILDVSDDTITGWENERCLPRIKHYPRLISFFGYNPFPMDAFTLGGRIKNFRIERGLTQQKLAHLIGVDETTIRSWEKNLHAPLSRKLKLIESIINQKESSK